jgi:hypothetical protein
MNRVFTLIIFSSLFLLACTGNSEPGGTSKAGTASSMNLREVKQVTRPFTDLDKQDTFRVVLTGEKPKEMLLSFTIVSYEGKEIYKQEFKAAQILESYKGNVDLKKEASQIKFMHDELNLFLDEENFLEPAITEAEEPDKNATDLAFYEELKQSGLNGFKYRLGKARQVYIAWSAKAGKVKVYYQCC